MWQLRYARPVFNYMVDNDGLVNGVRDALRLLAATEDGHPPWGSHNFGNGFYVTDIADHRVEYELRMDGDVRYLIAWSIQAIDIEFE